MQMSDESITEDILNITECDLRKSKCFCLVKLLNSINNIFTSIC